MPSANIPQAIATAVQARMINNGQSCIAAKRFIVHEAVYDTFAEGMKAAFETWVIGDPLEPTTQLGLLLLPPSVMNSTPRLNLPLPMVPRSFTAATLICRAIVSRGISLRRRCWQRSLQITPCFIRSYLDLWRCSFGYRP